MADPTGVLASPVGTFEGPEAVLGVLVELVQRHGVRRIVVGLPRLMSGAQGTAARQATAFAVHAALRTGLPVELWDERLSTVAIGRYQRPSRRTGRPREGTDALAAAVILQSFLDYWRGGSARAGEGV
ncbi:MAG: Holliday junction resolvase RuvX, partial [Chloroflexi bacterium]|nr:Holliday junction resolvase RuvX [Chloroflexota bacterium]